MGAGVHRAVLGACLALASVSAAALDLGRLRLPPGFHVTLYADGVDNARELALGAAGTLFIGTREAGKVYAAIDGDHNGIAERVLTIASDLPMPSGVAFRDGALYVAALDRVLRYDAIEARLERPPAPVQVVGGLPQDTHHGWKNIAFGPDGALYLPVGAPCNICEVPYPYGRILRVPIDGHGQVEVVAQGVRNSVGFDWHPVTGELWFGDNGRDMLGDDAPADEINRVSRDGEHFGYPYVHGGDLPDPELGAGHRPEDFTPPALRLGAHVAPVGLMFYRGSQFPPAYRGALFVAEHGSWNRSKKAGYRVMVARMDAAGRVTDYAPFITGWLEDETSWGRPVAFAMLPDGALLISDDQAGVVYRVTYEDKR